MYICSKVYNTNVIPTKGGENVILHGTREKSSERCVKKLLDYDDVLHPRDGNDEIIQYRISPEEWDAIKDNCVVKRFMERGFLFVSTKKLSIKDMDKLGKQRDFSNLYKTERNLKVAEHDNNNP